MFTGAVAPEWHWPTDSLQVTAAAAVQYRTREITSDSTLSIFTRYLISIPFRPQFHLNFRIPFRVITTPITSVMWPRKEIGYLYEPAAQIRSITDGNALQMPQV